jgi:septal ring factor EnvC (AmiA/AmiB activator)
MSTFKSKRPSSIILPEYSLVPTLKKLEILEQRSSKLKNLLQACETEKSSLKFEIGMLNNEMGKLNKKIIRIANEKRSTEAQLYMTQLSGKKKQTKKRRKNQKKKSKKML